MRRDEKKKVAGVGHGGLVGGRSLKSWQLSQTRKSVDAGCFTFCETADHERGVSVVYGHIGDKLLAVENRDIVDCPASECFNLELDVHFDGTRPLHGRSCLQGETEVFVLDLRNGDG